MTTASTTWKSTDTTKAYAPPKTRTPKAAAVGKSTTPVKAPAPAGRKRPRVRVVGKEAEKSEAKKAKRAKSPTPSDDERVYEVEDIERHRFFKGQKQYLIKWAGYSREMNTYVTQHVQLIPSLCTC